MSGNKSLKSRLSNGKGGKDGAIFLMKFEAWGRTRDVGALFDRNFKKTLPDTEAAVLDLTNDNEKK